MSTPLSSVFANLAKCPTFKQATETNLMSFSIEDGNIYVNLVGTPYKYDCSLRISENPLYIAFHTARDIFISNLQQHFKLMEERTQQQDEKPV